MENYKVAQFVKSSLESGQNLVLLCLFNSRTERRNWLGGFFGGGVLIFFLGDMECFNVIMLLFCVVHHRSGFLRVREVVCYF